MDDYSQRTSTTTTLQIFNQINPINMSAKNKLPKSVIKALENVSERLSMNRASFGFTNERVTLSNGEMVTIDKFIKDETRLYFAQDTKNIVDFLIKYGNGEVSLEGNGWIETL